MTKKAKRPFLLVPQSIEFPDANLALDEPNGLLAIGGDLSQARLLNAYAHGIFPWFSEGEPILWWSPTPRAVLYPNQIKISRSLKKSLNNKAISFSFDCAFSKVITQCRLLREQNEGTWITKEMQAAYLKLHEQGYAHSVEVWFEDQLVGGLYGLSLGGAFFGESMFHLKTDASKMALVKLCEKLSKWHFDFIDCQLPSAHLETLGVVEVKRRDFLSKLQQTLKRPTRQENWG